MSNRSDKEREEKLQPIRLKACKEKLEEMGFNVFQPSDTTLEFVSNGRRILFYPYSGWHTGASIKDGRGFKHLLDQII